MALDANPALPNIGRKPSAGSETFVVTESTTFELSAKSLLKDAKPIPLDIAVSPPQQTFYGIAQCSQLDQTISSELSLETQVSPDFRISSLENVLPRAVHVEKDGRREGLLNKGDTGTVLRGLPVIGEWRLSSPLEAGEDCDTALRSVRHRLRIKIHLACEG